MIHKRLGNCTLKTQGKRNLHSAQLYSYTFDPDATPSEQIELTVWSLSDSPTVRRVLSEYQQQHNDIAIQYTVAGSDDLATEDVLKALNTELLAGSGPDLIVFDGIDVTPYIENGVLADLNESLQEFSILDSIKNAFSVDGKTYIAAARYAIPSIWGTADDMDQITDLSSFIEFVKSCPSRDDYNLSDNAYYTALPEEDKYAASFMTPQEILQFLMSTSASELITDNTLNDGSLVTQWGEGIAADQAGYYASDEEKLYYVDFETNECRSLDGAGQIDSYGVLATIKGSSFCRNGIFYYVDDQGIVAYDTTNNSESRILTDTLAPFLQDDVSCVTLIVTDHQAIAVAADLNSETQTVYRYEI